MSLSIGDTAPNFTLPSTSGKDFTLYNDFHGKASIVYFYPKDFTPGCTAEACSFRDAFEMFNDFHVPIVGISPDDMETHIRFKATQSLQFDLLSDVHKTVSEQYKVLAPLVGFVQRVTFLLDADKKIAAVYQNLFDARSHIETMLAELNKRGAATAVKGMSA
jgi:thioredoxin-dependent peroxiredoxin